MRQQLRPDQEKVVYEVKRAASDKKRVVLVRMPTGAGKTTVMASLIESAARKASKVWVVVHREELARQAAGRIAGQGVRVGIHMGTGESTDPDAGVQVFGVQTLHNRLASALDGPTPTSFGMPNILFVDEAHHVVAPTWARVLAYARQVGAVSVLLSATPWVNGGQGLGVADALVDGPSPWDLVKAGVLVEPTIWCGPTPDLSSTKTSGGDFVAEALAAQTNLLVGDVVKTWKKHAGDRKTLCFAVNVAHSQLLVQEFINAGIHAAHVDAKTDDKEREDIFASLADDGIQVVSNVGIVTEGYDCPAVDAIIMARPTQSEQLFIQMAGRGARAAPGKDKFILLDHGYNCLRHGHPMMDRPVTLEGRGPRRKIPEKDVPTSNVNFRLCTHLDCMMANPSDARVCQACKRPLAVGTPPKEKRQVELVKFTELDAEGRSQVKVAERRAAFYRMQMVATGNDPRKTAWDVTYAYAKRFGIMPHEDRIFTTKGERESYWAKRKKVS